MKLTEMLEVVGGGIGGGVVANLAGNMLGRVSPTLNNGFVKGTLKLLIGAGGGILISKMLKKNNLAAGFFAGAAYEGSRDMISQVAPNFLSGLEGEETVEDYLLRSAGLSGNELNSWDEQLEVMKPSLNGKQLSGSQYVMEKINRLSDEEILQLDGLSDEEIEQFVNNRYAIL